MRSTTLRFTLAVLLLSSAGTTFGQTLYWNTSGTSATWTASNWGSVPAGPYTSAWTANSNAIFNANSTVTFASTSVGNVTVADGVTVTVTAVNTLSTNNSVRTFDIGTGSTLTWISQSVSNNSATGFTKNGAGTWNLGAGSGSNVYTGGFTLNSGTVIATGNNAFGGANSVLTINGGTIQTSGVPTFANSSIILGGDFTNTGTAATFSGTVALGSATRTITNTATGNRTFSGVISGSAGTGLTFAGTGVTLLSGSNTYTGATTVSGGTLRAGVDSTSGTSGAFGLNSNVTLENSAGATLDLNGFSNQIGTLSGGGTTGGNVTLGAGTLSVGGGTSATSTANYAGAISGTGGVIKIGSGTQVLSGSNNYIGVTTVSTGTLHFNTKASLYNGNSGNWNETTLVIESGAILGLTLGGATGFSAADIQQINQLGTTSGGLKAGSYLGIDTSNGNQTYANAITNSGSIPNTIGFAKLGANTLTITANIGATGGSSQNIRVLGGTLQVGNNGATGSLGSGTTVNVSSGAALAFNRNDSVNIANSLSGTGGVVQNGSGTTRLTRLGGNLYSGGTTINAGTLVAANTSGSATGTGAITVNSGGTLSGTTGTGTVGFVTGATAVLVGGTLRADSSTGTNTFTVGNVTIQNGGTLMSNLGGVTNEVGTASRLNVTGTNTLDFKTGSILKLDDASGFSVNGYGNYTLATLSSSSNLLLDGSSPTIDIFGVYTVGAQNPNSGPISLDVSSLPTLNNGDSLTLQRSGNNLVLNFSPVPEPGAILLVCGLVVGGFVAVRKLRRKGKPADVTPAA